jgi:diphthine-ammonia ligase
MSSTSLYVIALISGGKDSLFSLLHCIQNGHMVLALANLYPSSAAYPEQEDHSQTVEAEDLNSFMYQTVGHTIIPLYAEALNLPLYRRQIRGKAVNTGREYSFVEGGLPDETEDLIPLLQDIKEKHPDANALCTGAILSTYQRTRIESVAVRLGLTPLAYLWQYPALPPAAERPDSLTGLLDDMEAAGCDARLIKIASAGIKESLLWSRISDPLVRSRLITGISRFSHGDEFSLRGALLGEGGEYETLAVNGPNRVWKKKIEIDSKSNVTIQDQGGAVRLNFGKAILIDQALDPDHEYSPLVRVPVLLDDGFKLLRDMLRNTAYASGTRTMISDLNPRKCLKLNQNISEASASITVNNLIDPNLSSDIAEQTSSIITELDGMLRSFSDSTRPTPRIIATTILLRHMADFAALNIIYGKRFNHVNPPARVTICCGDSLPIGVLVSISFTLSRAHPARINGLHVQSISYWAPANIGPYSQANTVPASMHEGCTEEIVHVAGQIPLLPCSMQLLQDDFLDQAILSLQHLWRVGQCVGVDWWTHGVAYLDDAELEEIQRRAKIAWEVWREANAQAPGRHADDEDGESNINDGLDAWDLKYNLQTSHEQPRPNKQTSNPHLHILPNNNVLTRNGPSSLSQTTKLLIRPFLAAHVSSLPRSAPIEWHSLGLARLPKYPTSKPRLSISKETKDCLLLTSCRLDSPESSDTDSGLEDKSNDRMVAQVAKIDFFCIQIFTLSTPSHPGELTEQLQTTLSRLKHPKGGVREGAVCRLADLTIYISSQAGSDAITASDLANKGTVIPCRTLWGDGGRQVEIALVGQMERLQEST